ncbi:MAG: hypothetical protein R6U50_08625 [Desulfobacterales bacterium]
MIYVFHICIGILLITLQTSVIPLLPVRFEFYDILIPVVIYLGFFRPIRETIPILVFLGLMMDGISGTAFGFYLSSYVWIALAVIVIKQFFLTRNLLLLSIVTMLGVLIEHAIWFLMENVFEFKLHELTGIIRVAPLHLIVAAVTGPFIIIVLVRLQRFWEKRITARVFKRG